MYVPMPETVTLCNFSLYSIYTACRIQADDSYMYASSYVHVWYLCCFLAASLLHVGYKLMMYECILLAIYVHLCYFLAAAIQMWSAIFVSYGNLKPFSISAVEFGSQDTTKTKGPRTHKESLIFTLHFILQNLVLSVSVECI